MNDAQNWRVETDSSDFFGHQKKRMSVEQRRPVIRKASDLVGPGIGANATKITDFNDTLATFDGYFGAEAGAYSAPTSTQAYVGIVTSDGTLGGVQVFYGLADGGTYKRVFKRSSADASAISWGTWKADKSNTDDAGWIEVGSSDPLAPPMENSWAAFGAGYNTPAFMKRNGIVYLKGLISGGTAINATMFTLPVGYRPAVLSLVLGRSITTTTVAGGTAHTHDVQYVGCGININNTGAITAQTGSTSQVCLDGISFPVE